MVAVHVILQHLRTNRRLARSLRIRLRASAVRLAASGSCVGFLGSLRDVDADFRALWSGERGGCWWGKNCAGIAWWECVAP